jgi:hypothetical protein
VVEEPERHSRTAQPRHRCQKLITYASGRTHCRSSRYEYDGAIWVSFWTIEIPGWTTFCVGGRLKTPTGDALITAS